MYERSKSLYWGAVLETPDPLRLAEFYAAVLGWKISSTSDTWVTLHPGAGVGYVAMQKSPDYVPPTWPARPGEQQMMLHLDIEVADLQAAVDHAVQHGARAAEFQPQKTVRVMLDPDGHPFCLYLASDSDTSPD